jgi:hypothetical protein
MNFRLACLSVVLLASCVGPRVGASAPVIETRPGVALLTGPISMVDGKPVDSGAPIELSPGCHTLRTSSELLASPAERVTVRGTITPMNFGLTMNAGRNYWVERKTLNMVDTRSRLRITLYERDAAGNVGRTYAPMSAEDAAAFCATN